MNNYTYTNASSGDVLTEEALEKAIKGLMVKNPQEFSLITPNGYIHKGDAKQIGAILFSYFNEAQQ